MRTFHVLSLALFTAFVFSFFYTDAQAQVDPFVNGSFETGDFTGWTVVQQPGSSGDWFVYSGHNLSPLPSPPVGHFAAGTNQGGPSSQVLYQDIDVPEDVETCSLVYYYVVGALELVTGPDLSYSGDPNEQARIDILDPAADPFDVGAGVLSNLFQTNPGDPLSLGYTTLNFDLSAFAGSTVRFRAAEADNLGTFNFAIDDVRCGGPVTESIPTLGEWGMISMAGVLGLAGLIFASRKRSLAA